VIDLCLGGFFMCFGFVRLVVIGFVFVVLVILVGGVVVVGFV